MMPEREKQPVSVEDLLKVKRSERPDAQFWNGWQADMRARLAVAKEQPRPWWKDAFPRLGIWVARHQLSVGVACIAALTFVVVRQSSSAFSPLPGELPGESQGVDQAVVPSGQEHLLQAARVAPQRVLSGGQALLSDVRRLRAVSRAVMLLPSPEIDTPAARAIAANRAAAEAAHPELSGLYSFGDALDAFSLPSIPASLREAARQALPEQRGIAEVSGETSGQMRRQERLLSRLRDDAFGSAEVRVSSDPRGDRFSLRF